MARTVSAYSRLRDVAIDLMEREDVYGVELDEQGIHVMMSPVNRHELVLLRLQRQLLAQLPEDLVAHAGGEIDAPAVGSMRKPDLVVVPELAFTRSGYLDPADVEIVAEVVSVPNPENDYRTKAAEYPSMGIPVYLIIDPRKSTVSVLSEPGPTPDGTRYRARQDYVFGDVAAVGPYTVDTGQFLPYA
jgi:Uma2 family endonuclease